MYTTVLTNLQPDTTYAVSRRLPAIEMAPVAFTMGFLGAWAAVTTVPVAASPVETSFPLRVRVPAICTRGTGRVTGKTLMLGGWSSTWGTTTGWVVPYVEGRGSLGHAHLLAHSLLLEGVGQLCGAAHNVNLQQVARQCVRLQSSRDCAIQPCNETCAVAATC